MRNLTETERRILKFCESKKEQAKSDKHLEILIANYIGFLETISRLRTELEKTKESLAGMQELYKAKCESYLVSCQERARLISDKAFLKEQLEKLKRRVL